MNQTKNKNTGKLLFAIGIPVLLLLLVLRFVLYYFKSGGFSGLPFMLPLLTIGIIVFFLLMTGFLAAWVYQDCRARGDDGILWAVIIFVTTPFIGLLVYLLRRSDIKNTCAACGHIVSYQANYCEDCGSKIEHKEEITDMELHRTHHTGFIAIGIACMALMITCLIGFLFIAVSGKGVNTEITSDETFWNMGSIRKHYDSYAKGVWKLSFQSASEGFVAQEDMNISQSGSDSLYADISCGTVPEGASLTLYLVQGELAKSFDVTNLTEPLVYPLSDFQNGRLHVRLLIDGVEDTVSEIYIQE